MYWFRRPPYLRWAGALLLVATAAWLDLRPAPTVLQPFAASDLVAGTTVDESLVEWRRIPRGILPGLDEPRGTLLRTVSAGEPLLPSALSTRRIPTPAGWWTMEVQLPTGAVPGQEVQLILLPSGPDDEPRSVPGLVIAPAPTDPDPLAIEPEPGLVAVPENLAMMAAAAIAEGRVSTILGAASG